MYILYIYIMHIIQHCQQARRRFKSGKILPKNMINCCSICGGYYTVTYKIIYIYNFLHYMCQSNIINNILSHSQKLPMHKQWMLRASDGPVRRRRGFARGRVHAALPMPAAIQAAEGVVYRCIWEVRLLQNIRLWVLEEFILCWWKE